MNESNSSSIDFETAQDLPHLHNLLDLVQMKNGWDKPTPSLYPQPKEEFVPAHWKYVDARAALHAAGRLVGTEWAERRNLIMANPIPGNDYPTVKTIVGAYQMVKGGETARSHRHTPNAMRVILEADEKTYTIVEGVKVPMLPGDILLTPNWCYHGHSNESNTEAYWVDFLDAPLVQHLGPMFFEVHPDVLEKTEKIDEASPFRFAYADYKPTLLAKPELSKGLRMMELGPPTLTTFDRKVIHLENGSVYSPQKSTANMIYTVIEGSGVSDINGQKFQWNKGDMIAAPMWTIQHHTASSDAVLLKVSDEPLMAMLGWFKVS
jgi:gentisate 1,2-dioxygenase